MASRYRTSRIAYWMMVSFAPALQLSKSAQSFSQSLSAIHTPIAANRERYLAALLRSIVPPRERAQSLTTVQTAGCPPTEGSSLETAPRLQNNTAPASDRAGAYSKAYFSALSGAKDFGWWKQKVCRQQASVTFEPASGKKLQLNINISCLTFWLQEAFSLRLKAFPFLCCYRKFGMKGYEHCL